MSLTPPPHRRNIVITPTVLWRREACEAMLQALARQTVKPDEIYLILDRYSLTEDANDVPAVNGPPAIPEGFDDVTILWAPHFEWAAPGCRLQLADQLSYNPYAGPGLLFFLDDDVIPPPDYIERMVAAQARHGGLVQWRYQRVDDPPNPTPWFAGGLACTPAEVFRGIWTDPTASHLLVDRTMDDGIASAWLWKHNIPMTQVGGPGLTFHPLSRDARSIEHAIPSSTRRRLMWQLKEAWGWPGLPEHMGTSSPIALGEIHVLISSVSWRSESLLRLREELCAQTLLPNFVHILYDGPWTEDQISHTRNGRNAVGLMCFEHPDPTQHGPGRRWRYALNALANNRIVPHALIINIDDDVRIPCDFIERMVNASERLHTPVSAGGYTHDGFRATWPEDTVYSGPVVCVETGALAFEASLLPGLLQHPLADKLLAPEGDDEALLSSHFTPTTLNRIVIPGLTFDPTAEDPRALHKTNPERVEALRHELREATGWPWPGFKGGFAARMRAEQKPQAPMRKRGVRGRPRRNP